MLRTKDAYFNTTGVSGAELREHRGKARTQADTLLEWFRTNPAAERTPSECLAMLPKGTPLTSVRRALTTLTHAGALEKTERLKRGPYGRAEHAWRLRPHTPRQEALFG